MTIISNKHPTKSLVHYQISKIYKLLAQQPNPSLAILNLNLHLQKPSLWKDPNFRCVNADSKVVAWGLLLFDMLVGVGMVAVFSCMSSL